MPACGGQAKRKYARGGPSGIPADRLQTWSLRVTHAPATDNDFALVLADFIDPGVIDLDRPPRALRFASSFHTSGTSAAICLPPMLPVTEKFPTGPGFRNAPVTFKVAVVPPDSVTVRLADTDVSNP